MILTIDKAGCLHFYTTPDETVLAPRVSPLPPQVEMESLVILHLPTTFQQVGGLIAKKAVVIKNSLPMRLGAQLSTDAVAFQIDRHS